MLTTNAVTEAIRVKACANGECVNPPAGERCFVRPARPIRSWHTPTLSVSITDSQHLTASLRHRRDDTTEGLPHRGAIYTRSIEPRRNRKSENRWEGVNTNRPNADRKLLQYSLFHGSYGSQRVAHYQVIAS